MRITQNQRAAASASSQAAWRNALLALGAFCALWIGGIGEAAAEPRRAHGLSLFGELKYPPGFEHFDYVNPQAPQGGLVRLAEIGGFDSLNPFILKGQPAAGSQYIYDTLLVASADEPGSEYGLLAESVTVPEDFSWVEFTLRAGARWHDGEPITPEDVIFSLATLKEKGRPFYRFYYANVERAEKTGPRSVRFHFSTAGNRELPLIVGQLPILPRHYWLERDFAATTLEPPLGSGPYRIGAVTPGRSVTLERVDAYWGRDLAVNVGRHNFGRIRFEYYRDDAVALEAFKAGAYDLRFETSAKEWATAYDFPAMREGLVKKELLDTAQAEPMQAFVFNLRREKFQDPRVRRAFNLAFDFEWTNKALFYGQYARTDSFFEGSELEAEGPPSQAELALLEPFRDQVPPEVFTGDYAPPRSDGSGRNRENLRQARELLNAAGWRVENGVLRNVETGEPMRVEFLLVSPAFERVVAPYARNLARLGIKADIRLVDTAQYQNRLDNRDFDIVVASFPQSLSPGNEQRDFWGSEAADRPGSLNVAGIKDPAVDALIDKIIFAESRADLIAAARALDRVLLWRHYMVPQWHMPQLRVVMWDRLGHPEPLPEYDIAFPEIWWVDPDKHRAIAARLGLRELME